MELFRLGFLTVTLLDVIDVLLAAILIYQLYRLVKGTAAIYIFLGILMVYLFWLFVKALDMKLLSNILGQVIGVGVLAVIIVFQQEIRKFLTMIGSNSFLAKNNFPKGIFSKIIHEQKEPEIDSAPIIKALRQMSKSRTGAILVIEKNNDLSFFVNTGDVLDSVISKRLIENIFYKGSPMHDGAVIISQNKIKAARCILPISENPELPARLGMRHRAAIGITEQSDAVVITVSEETGEIAFVKEGEIKLNVSPEEIEKILESEFS